MNARLKYNFKKDAEMILLEIKHYSPKEFSSKA